MLTDDYDRCGWWPNNDAVGLAEDQTLRYQFSFDNVTFGGGEHKLATFTGGRSHHRCGAGAGDGSPDHRQELIPASYSAAEGGRGPPAPPPHQQPPPDGSGRGHSASLGTPNVLRNGVVLLVVFESLHDDRDRLRPDEFFPAGMPP